MAGSTRGKLKEGFEGIHRNLDWVAGHCQKMLTLIGDKNPKLSEGIAALGEEAHQLDELAQGLYVTL